MRNSKTITAAALIVAAAFVALSPATAKAQQLVQIEIAGPATLNVGDVQQYSATGTMDDGSSVDLTQNVSWVSSDEGVAVVDSVDQAGQVTGLAAGEVTINAYSDDGVVGSVTISVQDPSDVPQPDPGSDLTPFNQP